MAPVIPSPFYHLPDVFAQEAERLFAGGWVFGGMATELAADKDFLTFELAGQSVVLQNFKGEIKAFQNVCTHRFNKLQQEPFGNRPLLCNYHFWGFDATGFPRTIPRKSSFNFTDEELECLRLKQYKVALCGKFVFVKLSENSVSLEEHLGEYKPLLEELSNYIGDRFSWDDVPHDANWKLLIENVLECYHCSSVHADTFFKMGFGQQSPENIQTALSHSSCDFPKTEQPNTKRNKLMGYLEERPLKHTSYRHYFIFPNLVISSTEGMTFYIGQLLPQAAEKTTLRTRIFDTLLAEGRRESAVHSYFKEESAAISKTLLLEDKAVVEQVQKGIKQMSKPALFGAEEVRIQAFHQHYLSLFQPATPTADYTHHKSAVLQSATG